MKKTVFPYLKKNVKFGSILHFNFKKDDKTQIEIHRAENSDHLKQLQ